MLFFQCIFIHMHRLLRISITVLSIRLIGERYLDTRVQSTQSVDLNITSDDRNVPLPAFQAPQR
jgi:hypothetical protein